MKSLSTTLFTVLMLLVAIFTSSCKPNYDTVVDALAAFPGYLNEGNKGSYQLLAQEDIDAGTVLLYAYDSTIPDSIGFTCIATTFVTQTKSDGWRSQSASQLDCRPNFLQTDEFAASATVGGNITELATAYGIAPSGTHVRVSWNDGLVEMSSIQNGVFIAVRPETVLATKIELLDSNETVLQTIIP